MKPKLPDCIYCKPGTDGPHNGRGGHIRIPRSVAFGAPKSDPALGFDLGRAIKLGLVAA